MVHAVVLSLAALSCGGCIVTGAGIAKIVEELKEDQASVCVIITTFYGTVRFTRTNLRSGEVLCPMEGGLTMRTIQKGVAE